MKIFACKNKNLKERLQSTSGGIFPLLAREVIKNEGKIYAVKFDKQFTAVYDCGVSEQDILNFRGSKYTQAPLCDTFQKIKRDLLNGIPVLFVGTPCHVAGLKVFLGKEYKQLYCVDFICFGISSPEVLKKYLKENFNLQKIISVKFKDKKLGWHAFSTVVETEYKKYSKNGSCHPFMQAYLKAYSIRPSCYKCRFKGFESRRSDLTISDSWGIEKYHPEFDDDKGVSSVFINSEKGMELFNNIADFIDNIEISLQEATEFNPYYFKQIAEPKNRDIFFNLLKNKGFNYSIKWLRKTLGIDSSPYKNLVRKIREIFYVRFFKR